MRWGDFQIWPESAGPQADQIDLLTGIILLVCSAIALGVLIAMLWLCVRYRQGASVDRTSPPENSYFLEAIWVGVPVLIGVAIFVLGARAYYDLYVPDEQALEIEVVGEQWLWTIRHPSGRREINTLHLPVGEKIRLKMISQDVIHSFSLPEFRNKHDVLPGRYTYLALEPTRVGTYSLFCTEFCGSQHSKMGGQAIVVTPAEYAAWCAQDTEATTPEERGRVLYDKLACASCHDNTDGKKAMAAPLLDGVIGRTVAFEGGGSQVVDEEYIRRSILDPRSQIVAGFEPIMPSFRGQLDEDEMLDLIAFLRARTKPIPDRTRGDL